MKLGILGTGKVAVMLSGAWRKAGHEVTLGSRDPSSKNLGGGSALAGDERGERCP
jgi:predicted dinucleotide-binding enzyme